MINLNTRQNSKPVAFILMLAMLFSIVLPVPMAYAADVSSVLTGPKDGDGILLSLNPMIEIRQDGNLIEEGTLLPLSTNPIDISISFGVPVTGDAINGYSGPVVQKGDTARFKLSDAFTITPSGPMNFTDIDGIIVGQVSFQKDAGGVMWAEILFNGADRVFDGTSQGSEDSIYNVSCEFHANLQFDPDFAGGAWNDQTVMILDKEYTVNVPAPAIVYTMQKDGVADLSTKTILWTVTVSGIQEGNPVSLEGYVFYDNLSNVGEYAGDFKVNGISRTPTTAGGILRYTFSNSDVTTPAVITFTTKISDDDYYGNSERSKTNNAELRESNIKLVGSSKTVRFTPKWIEKDGVAGNQGDGGTYNAKDRTITWTIIANHFGASLGNVVITDALPAGLTVSHAAVQRWNEGTSLWGAMETLTPTSTTGMHSYTISNVNTMILVTIVTKVEDEDITVGTTPFTNTANIKWDARPGGITSNDKTVSIGYNAITKTGTVNPETGKVHWTVTVDAKGQNIPDMKVYDMLVYSTSTDFLINYVDGIPAGISRSALSPQFNQKYVDGSFSGAGLSLVVHPITENGDRVADLLEITGFTTSAAMTFSFDSLVINPDIFASNDRKTLWNTASLFSSNAKLKDATRTLDYYSRILEKEMLKRGHVNNPAAGVNDKTKTLGEGFDYIDKSVIYRLSINANGRDLTSALNAELEPFGDVIVTDTLPEGWEFADIVPGQKYLIFEGTTGEALSVTAADTVPDTVVSLSAIFIGRTATFTFENLDKPYVILIKAKPTDLKNLEYFSDNKTTNEENTLNIKAENWEPGKTVKQAVTITSSILTKRHNNAAAVVGELKWTVEYKPFELDMNATKLEDTLPLGVDVRVNASGELEIPGNITMQAMTLNSNGTYSLAAPVALVQGTNIFYDNVTRVLTFMIPDSSMAYRFEYITDVTGNPGTTVSNKATLYGITSGSIEAAQYYMIKSADASAVMMRTGWIGITKRGEGAALLSGAEFTLFAENGTVIRTGVTENDGSLILRGIPIGNYTLKETKAPAGYVLKNTGYQVTVTKPGISIEVYINSGSNTITIDNSKTPPPGPGGDGDDPPPATTEPAITTDSAVYGSIRIVKTDARDGRTLDGAVFQLFNENGVLLKTSSPTGSDGVILFDNLEAGAKYYLRELTAPAGYKPGSSSYSFRVPVNGGNTDVSITFKNTGVEDSGTFINIDPEDIPEGWIILEEEIPAGGWELDDTPKTGGEDYYALMLLLLALVTGLALTGNGIYVRRKAMHTGKDE